VPFLYTHRSNALKKDAPIRMPVAARTLAN